MEEDLAKSQGDFEKSQERLRELEEEKRRLVEEVGKKEELINNLLDTFRMQGQGQENPGSSNVLYLQDLVRDRDRRRAAQEQERSQTD